jgi:adenine-specific DNA-methyltransferase
VAKRKRAKRSTRVQAKRRIEQYAHEDKERVNNPPVGLVTRETDPVEPPRKKYAYDPHLDPQLVWAGKAERTSFEVPSVSLHVHERIDPKTIIAAVRSNGQGSGAVGNALRGVPPVDRDATSARQLPLFETRAANPPLRDALDFYKHPHGWTNRLIAGDSLLVMNSLLEKEGMAGKVQMIYLDPPYGIRYGSNFQPFVNRRDVKDGRTRT